MIRCLCKPTALFVVPALMLALTPIQAQAENSASQRAGGYEIYAQPRYTASASLQGAGGSRAEFDDTWGLGFGLAYNYNAHWSVHFEVEWSSTDYSATRVDLNGVSETYSSKLDSNRTTFAGKYNFFDKPLTPYVSGSIGWMYVDANMPLEPPPPGCWWDFWYGYSCSDQAPTKNQTYFVYGAGFGLRYDIGERLFFRAEYAKEWVDFDAASGEDFDVINFDLGWLFK